jgi:hypothetical protein
MAKRVRTLRADALTRAGHPDRNAQFVAVNERIISAGRYYRATGDAFG